MTLTETIHAYIGHLAGAGKSPKTLDAYQADLIQLAGHLSEAGVEAAEAVTLEMLAGFLDAKAPALSTRRRKASAIRGLFRHLEAQGVIGENPARNLPVPSLDGSAASAAPDEANIRRVVASAAYGTRDRALLELLALGVKPGEIAELRGDDYDPAAGTLDAGDEAKGKRRTIPLSATAICALDAYLAARPTRPTAARPWLILNMQDGQMTRFSVDAAVRTAESKVGVRVNSNEMRRARAATLRSMGLDWPDIAAQMGHLHLGTTRIVADEVTPRARRARGTAA